MSRARFSRVDEAWLRMDNPHNPMVITGVVELEGPVEEAKLREALIRRLLPYDRFTQRVVGDDGGLRAPVWESDPDFDLDRHIARAPLSPPGDQRALEAVVGALASRPLGRDRPLWRVHIVEGYAGGCVLVFRFHHAIADGMALMRILLSLHDDAPLPTSRPVRPRARRDERPSGPWSRAKGAAGYVRDGARLLALPPDPRTELKGALGPEKRVAWSAPIPLADVKAAGAALGATVNDVLAGALAGALRRYLVRRGRDVHDLDLRAIVPLNLRPPDEPLDPHRGLGNRFGLIVLALPVSSPDALGRVLRAQKRMQAIKRSKEAPVTVGLLSVLGRAPLQLETFGLTFLTAKASLVLTNVPGPPEPVRIAGQLIRRVIAWVPRAGKIGVGVSLVSYAGEITIGVISDAKLLADPGELVGGIVDELAALRSLAPDRALRPDEGPRPGLST